MSTIKVSKDGKKFFEIKDSVEEIEQAESKGYKRYLDVSKDGEKFYSIPMTEEDLKTSFAKGYQTRIHWQDVKNTKAKNKPSKLEAISRGIGQGATLGFEDEISAGVRSLFSDRSYKDIRDDLRTANKKAQEAHPYAYTGGELAGGLASGAAAPGAAIAKGTSLLGKMAAGAAVGAAEGGLAGAGYSDSEDSHEVMNDAGRGVAMGGALGAGLPVAGAIARAIGRGAKKAAKPAVRGAMSKESTTEDSLGVALTGLPVGRIKNIAGEYFGEFNNSRALKKLGVKNKEEFTKLLSDPSSNPELADQVLPKVAQNMAAQNPRIDVEEAEQLLRIGTKGRKASGNFDDQYVQDLRIRSQKNLDDFKKDAYEKYQAALDKTPDTGTQASEASIQRLKDEIEKRSEFLPKKLLDVGGKTFEELSKEAPSVDRMLLLRREIDDQIEAMDKKGLKNKSKFLKEFRALINESMTKEVRSADADYANFAGLREDIFDPIRKGPAKNKQEVLDSLIERQLGNRATAKNYRQALEGINPDELPAGAKEYLKDYELASELKNNKTIMGKVDYAAKGPSGRSIDNYLADPGNLRGLIKDPARMLNYIDTKAPDLTDTQRKNASLLGRMFLEGQDKPTLDGFDKFMSGVLRASAAQSGKPRE